MLSAANLPDVSSEGGVRVGLIIPAINVMSEPQFNRYAPENLGVFVTRARVAGVWRRSLPEMADEIATSARLLSDCKPDLIVFHCTDTSMAGGVKGERAVLDIVEKASGVTAVATSGLVLEALHTLALKRVAVLSPYKTNSNVNSYLQSAGIEVTKDVALGLEPPSYPKVKPQFWVEKALENDGPDVDGFFLSCTNTSQLEAIPEIERATGKAAVSSNQAVLFGCISRFKEDVGETPRRLQSTRLFTKATRS